ncbi:Vitamin B12 ABC transporter, substrate-binding protein BtuF [hydrothermal vent metagenome]|uniref:Vitamin B12 ABC transporter, substrate-binding protein BtuF n=1 Tax=hydrothermal vent metagenome TaxID=652676 RepID=A0A3B0RJW6_9ZZZZ
MAKEDHIKKIFWSVAALILLPVMVRAAEIGKEMAKPKIVSLDYCADQYVLALADRDQIMALSMDADQGHSFYRDRAQGLPKFHSSMAEIVNLKPDLAVQSWRVTARLEKIINRVGTKLIIPRFGSDPKIVIGNVRRAGESFDQATRAKALIEDYRTRLEALYSIPKSPLKAAYITPSGFTAGTGTFVDEIIRLAGLSSYAAARHIVGWQALPLEDLIMDPPDVFIASFFDTNLDSQSEWSISRHGRLYKMMEDIPTIYLPGRYLSCNGLFLVDAAERIHEEAPKDD